MKTLVLWLPRVGGVVMVFVLAAFALDSVRGPFVDALMHLLPALLVAAIVALAWKYPLVGAVCFAVCGVGYGIMTRRPDWFMAIGLPLLIVSALYAVNARMAARV